MHPHRPNRIRTSFAFCLPLLVAASGWSSGTRSVGLNSFYGGPEFVMGSTTVKGTGASTDGETDRTSIGLMTGVRGSILGSIFFGGAEDAFQVGEMEIVELALNHTSSDLEVDNGIGFDARYGVGVEGNAKVGGGFIAGASWSTIFDRKTARQGNADGPGQSSEQTMSFTQIVHAQLGHDNVAVDAGIGNHGYLALGFRCYASESSLGEYYAVEFDRFDRELGGGRTNASNDIRLLIGMDLR